MPKDADIIRVDGLDGAIWIWAIVDTDQPLYDRHFELYKTGGEMPVDIGDYNYIGCGAIFVQMELMMYTATPSADIPPPFNWQEHQEK